MFDSIEPRDTMAGPRPDRIATVRLAGCDFAVGWDGESAEPDTYCDGYISVPGSPAAAWVECVNLDGKWWEAREVFTETFCSQLDAALCALEEFGAPA